MPRRAPTRPSDVRPPPRRAGSGSSRGVSRPTERGDFPLQDGPLLGRRELAQALVLQAEIAGVTGVAQDPHDLPIVDLAFVERAGVPVILPTDRATNLALVFGVADVLA